MKNLIVTRGGMVAWSSMLLWILTALIVYLAVGKDWILAVDIFYGMGLAYWRNTVRNG